MINLGLRLLRDYSVLIYAPNLKNAFHGRVAGIVFDDQARLFRRAGRLAARHRPEVAIFHHGGVSFPILDAPECKGLNPRDH